MRKNAMPFYTCFKLLLILLLVVCISPSAGPMAAASELLKAGELLVDLDARDDSAGDAAWRNSGSLGPFTRVGAVKAGIVAGVKAVSLGNDAFFVGPPAPESVTGNRPRSIEVWVFNPSLDSPEETIIAWGKRGGPAGANMSFNHGSNPKFGAATHWANDLGWDVMPAAGRWHHLVYTYDGTTVRIYDNGAEQGSRKTALNTAANQPINLGAQNSPDGKPVQGNVADNSSLAGSLALAVVRVHAGTLTTEQIKANFQADAKRFGAAPGTSLARMLETPAKVESDDLTLRLLPNTQTPVALSPKGMDFDFTVGDKIRQRLAGGFYHLGDVTFRAHAGSGPWKTFKTNSVPSAAKTVDAAGSLADLTETVGPHCPVSIERRWLNDRGRLVMRVVVRNKTDQPVELGAFGVAMVFNNNFIGRSLDDVHERCSLADPYIGGDAGYLQITRVNGAGPVLLVLPECGTGFEAYRPLGDEPTPRSCTFEGFYEWTVHSKAYAENEWKKAVPWNAPTARTLQPGEKAQYGFVFVTAPGMDAIEKTLAAQGHPVAVGLPGYVLPMDQRFRLMIRGSSEIKSITVEPSSTLSITAEAEPTANGWRGYSVEGNREGTARVVVAYAGGRRQFIHYKVIPSQAEQVERVARFHQEKQWYTDVKDPFKRTYSYMGWDRDADALVLQDTAVFNAGLSDECGAGPNLLMAMKNLLMPDPKQVEQLEQYVDHALWGNLQYKDNYGVKASLFYWDPKTHPGYYTIPGGWWDKPRSDITWRAYNYPHQAAVYWSLYRLARNHEGLVKSHSWDWYLRQAYRTALVMRDHCGPKDFTFLAQYGLMDGAVFLEILADLRREGWTKEADELEKYNKTRMAIWKSLKYPYGSEMPWDTTGQEEVYLWARHFGETASADTTLKAVRAYTPIVPNWGYNGSSRRYFDSACYGHRALLARELQHYGASLNAIPLLDAFRRDGHNLDLLRAGYAGANGVLCNIDSRGRSSMCFLADPAVMDYEPFSGDYGSAFFGFVQNAGSYAVRDKEFGWLGFGCQVSENKSVLTVVPQDAFRSRVYLAPVKLSLVLDAGTFERVQYDTISGKVHLTFAPATSHTRTALLRIEDFAVDAKNGRRYKPATPSETFRSMTAVQLGPQSVSLTLARTQALGTSN